MNYVTARVPVFIITGAIIKQEEKIIFSRIFYTSQSNYIKWFVSNKNKLKKIKKTTMESV